MECSLYKIDKTNKNKKYILSLEVHILWYYFTHSLSSANTDATIKWIIIIISYIPIYMHVNDNFNLLILVCSWDKDLKEFLCAVSTKIDIR